MPVSKFNRLSPIIQHLIQLGVVAFLAGVTYTTMNSDIHLLQVSAAESKTVVTELSKDVSTIKTEQAVMKTEISAEQRRSQDFRQRTDKALDRILKKLDEK